VVVLLHGFPQDGSSFDGVLPLLLEQELRTLVPTQRGYVATARPRRRRDYRLPELVADVIALLDAAGVRRAHLVGHDWGGGVAWGVAGWRPDRLHSLTVLSTPHPSAMTAAMLRSSQALRSWYMAAFQLPAVPEWVLSRKLNEALSGSGLPAGQVARYCELMAQDGTATGALNWYRALPLAFRTPVPDITVPTSYLWGTKDFALGRYAAERTGEHVNADYRFDPVEAGHWLPETRPELVARAILDRARPVGRGDPR